MQMHYQINTYRKKKRSWHITLENTNNIKRLACTYRQYASRPSKPRDTESETKV